MSSFSFKKFKKNILGLRLFFSFSNILEIIAQYTLKCGGQGDHTLGKLCFSDYLFAKIA